MTKHSSQSTHDRFTTNSHGFMALVRVRDRDRDREYLTQKESERLDDSTYRRVARAGAGRARGQLTGGKPERIPAKAVA